MAKGTKDKKRLEVSFTGVSFGKGTARLGILINREDLTLQEADHLLCGARLNVSAQVTDGEKPLLPDAMPRFSDVADSMRVSLGTDDIRAGLTFSRKGVEPNIICNFINKKGVLDVQYVGAVEHEDADDQADEE